MHGKIIQEGSVKMWTNASVIRGFVARVTNASISLEVIDVSVPEDTPSPQMGSRAKTWTNAVYDRVVDLPVLMGVASISPVAISVNVHLDIGLAVVIGAKISTSAANHLVRAPSITTIAIKKIVLTSKGLTSVL
jgi:hypothetical protein